MTVATEGAEKLGITVTEGAEELVIMAEGAEELVITAEGAEELVVMEGGEELVSVSVEIMSSSSSSSDPSARWVG